MEGIAVERLYCVDIAQLIIIDLGKRKIDYNTMDNYIMATLIKKAQKEYSLDEV